MTVRNTASLLLALGALLAGCRSEPAEDRITDAMPLSQAARAAREALVSAAAEGGVDVADLDAALAARMKVRAVECAKGYVPGVFEERQDIRDKLAPERACFDAHDARIAQWFGERRLGVLLRAGPLRPVPARVASMTLPEPVAHTDFAAQAGIGLFSGKTQAWVVDLGTGRVLSTSPAGQPGLFSSVGGLSPNGRLFVAATGDGAEVRDSATGLALAHFPGMSEHVQWVGEAGVLMWPKARGDGPRTAVFRDLATGLESRLPGARGNLAPVAGATDQFLLLDITSLPQKLVLARTPAGWTARVEKAAGYATPISMLGTADEKVTADGRTVLDPRGPLLDLFDLRTGAQRRVQMGPFRPAAAFALSDPDQVLLFGDYQDVEGAPMEWLVYSLGQGTAAPVPVDPAARGWVTFVPSTRSVLRVEGNRVRPEAVTPTQPFGDLATVVAARQAELAVQTRTQLEERRVSTAFAFLDRNGKGAAPKDVVPIQGPVLELGRKARVIAIGVYDGEGPRNVSRGGTVQVKVMRTRGPIILVLASYDPVTWVVSTDPGAEVGAILQSSHDPGARVMGSLAPVHRIGTHWASSGGEGDMDWLEADVKRWTGKGIDRFLGKHDGDYFIVRE